MLEDTGFPNIASRYARLLQEFFYTLSSPWSFLLVLWTFYIYIFSKNYSTTLNLLDTMPLCKISLTRRLPPIHSLPHITTPSPSHTTIVMKLFLPCSATNRSTCGCSTTNRRTRGCITSGCSTTNCSVPGFSVTNRSIPGFSATNRSTVVVVLQTDVLQIVLFRDLDTMQSPMSLVGPSSWSHLLYLIRLYPQ